jgi:AmmeMemoRadiSam system protein A
VSREPLPDDDRVVLLEIAREAVAARLAGNATPRRAVSARLEEKAGAFVTLTRRDDGSLRGCVGYVGAAFPLWEAVARAAEAAACEDGRFDPVRPAELGELAVEISILDEPRPLMAEAIEVGTHGLLIRQGGRSGLLLPQVPVEHGWDRRTFLEQTCRKAGLPKDAWTDANAEVLGFTAEVFGDDSGESS